MEELTDEEKKKLFIKTGISILVLIIVAIIGIILVVNKKDLLKVFFILKIILQEFQQSYSILKSILTFLFS